MKKVIVLFILVLVFFSCDINSNSACEEIPVTSVSLDTSSISLGIGNTQQLTATVLPDDATDKTVTWSTSSGSVATVSSSGLVTAVAAGSARITVITDDGYYTDTASVTVSAPAPTPIVTPAFNKDFSGSVALVLDPFELPAGLYKITVNTTGFFQLFDVGNNETFFNLGSGEGVGAETYIHSTGGNYTFRTDNISASWTLNFTNIDFSSPDPISDINSVNASVPKLLGPYLLETGTYRVTMYTDGFFQLFPINSTTGEEESYIFNESSGNNGAQNVYNPSTTIMLFRTDNVSTSYSIYFTKL